MTPEDWLAVLIIWRLGLPSLSRLAWIGSGLPDRGMKKQGILILIGDLAFVAYAVYTITG